MKIKISVPKDSKINFDRAVDFLKKKLEGFDTERLEVNIHLGESNKRYSGLCQYPVVRVKKPKGSSKGWYYNRKKGIYKIFARVSSKFDYPYEEMVYVGTIQKDKVPIPRDELFNKRIDENGNVFFSIYGEWDGKVLTEPDYPAEYYWIVEKRVMRDLEDMVVELLGHETWHFLCHSGQMKGTGERNTQARANLEGLRWLREFQELYK